MKARSFELGASLSSDATGDPQAFKISPHHLVTHACILGMTGSGKSGLVMVLVEEALRSQVPVIVIDIKGDLPNLMLAFPDHAAARYVPWVDATAAARSGQSTTQIAERTARGRESELAGWDLADAPRELHDVAAVRLLTPGSLAGEPMHVLSSLERPSPLWGHDDEAARQALGAAVSLVLRLLGRDADPARSREHVVLSVFAERRLRAGLPCSIDALIEDLDAPPIEKLGAMTLDAFLHVRERRALAASLNALLASPTFASWRQGVPLDIEAWLAPRADGRTPAVVVSVAHLDDEERMLVVGMLLEEILTWVRTLPGTSALRALVVFDEVYGFLPPHPANPPSKRPLVALMKQARAFGVGIVVATQNPMDLDYRALGNAGCWWIGRLQTDADRARVVEGLRGNDGFGWDPEVLASTLKRLAPRWFVMRDVHANESACLLQVRPTLAWMRGPMTRREIARVAHASDRDNDA